MLTTGWVGEAPGNFGEGCRHAQPQWPLSDSPHRDTLPMPGQAWGYLSNQKYLCAHTFIHTCTQKYSCIHIHSQYTPSHTNTQQSTQAHILGHMCTHNVLTSTHKLMHTYKHITDLHLHVLTILPSSVLPSSCRHTQLCLSLNITGPASGSTGQELCVTNSICGSHDLPWFLVGWCCEDEGLARTSLWPEWLWGISL